VDEEIYRRPRDYDLEHEDDDEDVAFYVELTKRLRPRRVLELGAGSGRVTTPLAELAARTGFTVTALDASPEMLAEAKRKLAAAGPRVRERVELVTGDMRTWEAAEPFDVVLVPCASVSHLLTLDDQLAVWSRAHANLVPGGRFVVDVAMPDLAVLAESMRQPARALVEIDSDTADDEGRRLVRYRTTDYAPLEQRASIRFLYDKFAGERAERWVSDFESHVYFPRELELLYRQTGFVVEATYGDYRFRTPRPSPRALVLVGRTRPAAD
jgi:SAM-dependent methyltransferase